MKKISLLTLSILLLTACQEKKADRFVREAREYTTKHCPERVDDYTTLDSLVFDKEGEGCLSWYFSMTLDSVQEQTVAESRDDIVQQNIQHVRNSVMFIPYRAEGVRFRYIYTNAANGKRLLEVDVAKEDYK